MWDLLLASIVKYVAYLIFFLYLKYKGTKKKPLLRINCSKKCNFAARNI